MRQVPSSFRQTAIRPLWWRVGVTLWGTVLALGSLLLAQQVAPGGVAAVASGVADGWGALQARVAPAPASRTATNIGAAPDFTLALFDGGAFRLADQRGRAVVLNVWASWCVPCRAEAPTFAKVSAAYRDRGVVFVGVNVQDTDADARRFLEEFGISYPNGPDRAFEIATDYGVAGIPTTVFVDAGGRIARRWAGELSEARLLRFVEEIAP